MSTRYPFIRTLSWLIEAAGVVALIACMVAGFSSMDKMGMPASRQLVVLIPWALAGLLSLAVLSMLAEFCVVAADIGDNTARLADAAGRDGPQDSAAAEQETAGPKPGPARACPNCATPQEPDAAYCDQCGAKVAPAANGEVES